MTNTQISEIKALSKRVHIGLPEQHKGEMQEAQRRLHEAQVKCDHKNADGSSAWQDGFAVAFCTICGENDL